MSLSDAGLNYQQFGRSGPVCIILHGLLGSSDNWISMAKRIGRHYRVYALDLRNHGASFHSPEMGYPEMAEDVRRFIEGITGGPACVIGHSMGGKAGMELALSFPDVVERLVVVDISPFRYRALYNNVFDRLKKLHISELKSRGEADRELVEHIPDRMLRLFLLKNIGRNDSGGFSWKVNLDALAVNYHKIWDSIDTSRQFEKPVLFMEGELSNAEIKLQFEEIKKTFPLAEYKLMKNAGHWVHSEKPDDFYRTVKNFLLR